MHFFTVLGDSVRRRILEHLIDRPLASGEIVERINDEFGISQSAISQQLKVLRENGFATVRVEGNRRIYTLDTTGFEQMEEWISPFRRFWAPKFAALANEIERGKQQKKRKRTR